MERLEHIGAQDKKTVPESFPIVAHEDMEMWFDPQTDENLPENQIVFYTRFFPPDKKLKGYKLLRPIGNHEYVFRCSEKLGGDFGLDFKTRGHEYSRTDLKENEAEELGETIRSFVATVRQQGVESLSVSPADHAYSVEDVEDCKTEILTDFADELESYVGVRWGDETPQEYLNTLLPHQIFDLRNKLSGEYKGRPGDGKSFAHARARLFKSYIETYLPDWKIDESYVYPGSDFRLVTKETELE